MSQHCIPLQRVCCAVRRAISLTLPVCVCVCLLLCVQLDLTPADFEWATSQILTVASVCCPGKVVSVLEGGYGNYAPDNSKESVSGWTVSREKLAENVSAHLSALAGVTCHAE